MIGNHIAQSAGSFIVATALLHTDCFGGGDLDVIDIAPVPDRFKNSVAETKYQDVLDRLFAKIMIDPVDLLFLDHLLDLCIKCSSRFQISTKRFFDNHA